MINTTQPKIEIFNKSNKISVHILNSDTVLQYYVLIINQIAWLRLTFMSLSPLPVLLKSLSTQPHAQCMMKGLGLKTEMNLLFIIISLKLEIAELF